MSKDLLYLSNHPGPAIEFRPSSKTKKTHIHLTFEPTNIIPKTPSLPDRDKTCSFLKKTIEKLTL
jgi:hypothetical protein